MLNAIGLANLGLERFISEKLPLIEKYDTPFFVNVAGKQIDDYIENHSEVVFSHGICPVCIKELYGEKEWFKKKYPSEK